MRARTNGPPPGRHRSFRRSSGGVPVPPPGASPQRVAAGRRCTMDACVDPRRGASDSRTTGSWSRQSRSPGGEARGRPRRSWPDDMPTDTVGEHRLPRIAALFHVKRLAANGSNAVTDGAAQPARIAALTVRSCCRSVAAYARRRSPSTATEIPRPTTPAPVRRTPRSVRLRPADCGRLAMVAFGPRTNGKELDAGQICPHRPHRAMQRRRRRPPHALPLCSTGKALAGRRRRCGSTWNTSCSAGYLPARLPKRQGTAPADQHLAADPLHAGPAAGPDARGAVPAGMPATLAERGSTRTH